MENNQLQRVLHIKYLGIVIDEKLKWRQHIETLRIKISRASYILSKLRHYVDLNTLKLTYYNLVYPFLNYCITVWGGASKSSLQPIVNLQKKFLESSRKAHTLIHQFHYLSNLNFYR